MNSESRVRPALDLIDAFLVDFAALLEYPEERVAKGVFELAEVDVGVLVEVAFAVEDSRGHQRMEVGVAVDEIAEGL